MNWRITTAVLLLCVVCVGARSADDPLIGTWKLNLVKSKISPLPKSRIVTIVKDGGDGIKLKTEEITAEGKKRTVEYSAKFDGKEYPRIESGAGAVEGQTVTLKRIDANRAERTIYLTGKKLRSEIWEVSEDGKVRTVKEAGTNSKGQSVDTFLVFDRQ